MSIRVVEQKISAVLLAAGLSLRMGEDKLLLSLRGETLLQRAVGLLMMLPVHERILVTTEERLKKITLPPEIKVEINPHPETGQSGSVQMGVTAATGDWYMFMAADQPGLTAADLHPLIEEACGGKSYNKSGDKYKIIYPVVNGSPNTPVLFSSAFREELLAISGDEGGRSVRDAHPEACFPFTPEAPELFFDIDDIDDYSAIPGR